MITNQPTGRSIFLDKEYPLFFEILQTEHKIVIRIPFPDGYPDTALSNELVMGLALLELVNRDDGIYLANFFLKPLMKRYRPFVLPNELAPLKGLGKIMLCLGLNIFSSAIKPIRDSTMIFLEAAGGECFDENIKNYEDIPIEELIKRLRRNERTAEILKKSIEGTGKIKKHTKKDREKLENALCEIDANYRLVDYYRSYGLSIIDETIGTSIKMAGKVSDMLKKCGYSFLGKRKSKRKKSRKKSIKRSSR